jgi:hypothetical protein
MLGDVLRVPVRGDSYAPGEEVALNVGNAMMCNIAEETCKGRCNPWARGATEVCHKLVTTDGEIGERGGDLHRISLLTRSEEHGGATPRSTRSDPSTNLSRSIAWISCGGGGCDTQRDAV